ncbi:Kynureninase [Porphyridium purpureum]|uniref:Kynureninase n=1 Tax=Porphyridium purpureum TaxID=35688 RepID=A0A5J4Z3U6_PORPP|nr:Kynureninase [Porphyridium purpureum]|eukprot:POR1884..scf295_1
MMFEINGFGVMGGVEEYDRQRARHLDADDPFAVFRNQFRIPTAEDDPEAPCVYLCGNSLGLLSDSAQDRVHRHLEKWARRGVGGHFGGTDAWVDIENGTSQSQASMDLVGARFSHEVVYMNSLTVNLHLLMTAFYRPRGTRTKILIEDKAFPSDCHAVFTHLASRGFTDPAAHTIVVKPRPEEYVLRKEDIIEAIVANRDELALVMLPGVQYYTGQVLPMQDIAAVCNELRIPFGLDLAHAVGNVVLCLHEWGVDFGVWCSYKYLNGGPGGVAGAFMHDKHANKDVFELPRLGGWWGHDPETRFEMGPEFVPRKGILGFQLSNPPVLALAPLLASLDVFEAAGGVYALRQKSVQQTEFLIELLNKYLAGGDGAGHGDAARGSLFRIITPLDDEEARGCQISILLTQGRAKDIHALLARNGVVCDTREPDVLRVAPVPLYNSFSDVLTFVDMLAHACRVVYSKHAHH